MKKPGRLGKSALEIFDQPALVNTPVAGDTSLGEPTSLLATAPILAWGLWWQDICYLQTCRVTRFWCP